MRIILRAAASARSILLLLASSTRALSLQRTPAMRPTLLVSFTTDRASVTLASALMRDAGEWEEHAAGSGLWRALRPESAPAVFLWMIDASPLDSDHIDERFAAMTEGPTPSEVLFLSRHVSAARTASLCVHPIGNPRAELAAEAGGAAGVCVPPAPRLAALFRLLCEETVAERARAASPEAFDFQPSFEATHHGPLLASPSAFLEIGSDEVQWARADAGAVWARVLARALGLGGRAEEAKGWDALSAAERAGCTAVLVLGGGHYMPAAGDVAKGTHDGRLFIGHMLASYALSFSEEGSSWRGAVDSAVRATHAAFPGVGALSALVPKKAFGASDRTALADCLTLEHGIRVSFTKGEVLSTHREFCQAALAVSSSGISLGRQL